MYFRIKLTPKILTGGIKMTQKQTPYADPGTCFKALLEQLPIQITRFFRQEKRYLFCYCMCAVDANGQTIGPDGTINDVKAEPVDFQDRNRFDHKNWGQTRFDGYAAAIKYGHADEIVLFGPIHEIELGQKYLTRNHGIAAEQISYCETPVSTKGNAKVMRAFLRKRQIPIQWVRMSSSAYHLRAFIASFDGCLLVRSMFAEAYLFAEFDRTTVEGEDSRSKLRKKLIAEFGDSDLTRRFVEEIQGCHDLILDNPDNYDTPPGG